ncbi:hypothetical protein FIBSPDRAFT_727724, partial [Athelia psychrophila]
MPSFNGGDDRALIASRAPGLETWHRRLGHTNVRSLVDMVDSHMVSGMHINLSSEPLKCQSCILGKQTHNSVLKVHEGVRAEGILECVHIDLTGPQAIVSANGNTYVMNIIDD